MTIIIRNKPSAVDWTRRNWRQSHPSYTQGLAEFVSACLLSGLETLEEDVRSTAQLTTLGSIALVSSEAGWLSWCASPDTSVGDVCIACAVDLNPEIKLCIASKLDSDLERLRLLHGRDGLRILGLITEWQYDRSGVTTLTARVALARA